MSVYPKYSAAWFDLGRLHEQRDPSRGRRKAYHQAIAAEPKFIQPYERLSWLALRDAKWQDLVDCTDQWLRLDPLNSRRCILPEQHRQSADCSITTSRKRTRARPSAWIPPRRTCGRTTCWAWRWRRNRTSRRPRNPFGSTWMRLPTRRTPTCIRKQLAQIEEAAREAGAGAAKPE